MLRRDPDERCRQGQRGTRVGLCYFEPHQDDQGIGGCGRGHDHRVQRRRRHKPGGGGGVRCSGAGADFRAPPFLLQLRGFHEAPEQRKERLRRQDHQHLLNQLLRGDRVFQDGRQVQAGFRKQHERHRPAEPRGVQRQTVHEGIVRAGFSEARHDAGQDHARDRRHSAPPVLRGQRHVLRSDPSVFQRFQD